VNPHARYGGAIRKKIAAECAYTQPTPVVAISRYSRPEAAPTAVYAFRLRITSRTFQAWAARHRFAVFTNLYYDSAGADKLRPWARGDWVENEKQLREMPASSSAF